MEHLNIKYAADAAPLVADRFSVQCYSSCARGLPAAAEEWDLSQLLLEGQPVQRETVVSWLNAMSQHLNNEPMIGDDPETDRPARSMASLAQLLAFADAVGTSRGLLLAIEAQVSAGAPLVAEVQMGEQQLQLAADSYCCFSKDATLSMWCLHAGASTPTKLVTAASADEKQRCLQQFVQQLEALLYLAYKLQLPQLQLVIHQCISTNSCNKFAALGADALRFVASARVLDAAGSCGDAQQAFIACANTTLAAFSGGDKGRLQLLRPLGLTAEQQERMKFKAELLEDLYHHRKGQVVNVVLDLFEDSAMRLSVDEPGAKVVPYPVHLALGQQLQWQLEAQ